MNKLPLARNTDIVIQELGKETLIYDLNTHKAYNLNETSSTVYRACDGRTTFEELRVKTKFNDDIIFLAIDGLRKENLLEENRSYNSPFAGMSRREVIRRVGLASMIALPVISSLVAPTAAAAQSGGTCPSGVCIPPGQNVCAGCINTTRNYTQYSSTNGSCTGSTTGTVTVVCDSPSDTLTFVTDVFRN